MKHTKLNKAILILSFIFMYACTNENVAQNNQFNSVQRKHLETLLKQDQEDPSYTDEMYKQDIELLTHALERDPTNEHYLFYLAHAHKRLRQFDESIKWSKARLEKEGKKEEIWYTKFLLGQSYQEKNDWDQALHWYLEAFQYNPKRAEPLHKISNYYRIHGQNNLAYFYAKQGAFIPYPKETFFVSKPVYDYNFDEEISIVGFYTNFKHEGFAASNRLLLNKKVPQPIKESTKRNILYYIPNIKNVGSQKIAFELPLVKEGVQETYHPLNPTILKTEQGYKVICRTINYIRKGQQFIFCTDDHVVRTKNFLLHYDHDFKLTSQQEIIENVEREHHHWLPIVGLEDCRLIPTDKNTSFTCTICDASASAPKIAYCRVAEGALTDPVNVDKFALLNGPNPNRWEKNWLPFFKNEELYTIYSYDPFIINKPNIETGEWAISSHYEPAHDFTTFKGSAGPIAWNDGYLVMIHETVFNHQLNYIHRLVFLDKEYKIQEVSRPFTFDHMGVEFCSGMVIDHSGKKLILTVGMEDNEAYFYFVDLDVAKGMLEPLPES